MDIYLGCPDAVMSHKLLHNLQVCALLYKVRGKGVAQQVRINPLCYAGFLCRSLQTFRHNAFSELLARRPLKEPYLRLVQFSVFGQFLYQWF